MKKKNNVFEFLNATCFDAATAPIIIVSLGAAILPVVLILLITALAIKLIRHALHKKNEKKKE